MPISESRKRANIKWQKNNYVRIPLDVRPPVKEHIKRAADAAGMTVGAYIKLAVSEKMARDAAARSGKP